MGFGSQGQGVRGHLQSGRSALGVLQSLRPRPHQDYTEVGRQVHGPDWDPSAHDLDGELIMKLGGGKKHGRYFIGEGTLDTASTPTLSQIRARTTDSGLPIRPRLSVAELRVQELEVNLGLFIVHSICI